MNKAFGGSPKRARAAPSKESLEGRIVGGGGAPTTTLLGKRTETGKKQKREMGPPIVGYLAPGNNSGNKN